MQKNKELKIAYDLFLFGSILIMALYHLGLFSLRKKERSALYFGLFCLIIAVRDLNTGDKFLLQIFPGIDYEMSLKLEYLTFYLAVPVFFQYFYSIFRYRLSKTIGILCTCVGLEFGAMVILFPVKIFSYTLTAYQGFTVTVCIYAIVELVIASLKKEYKAIIFLTGFIVLFFILHFP